MSEQPPGTPGPAADEPPPPPPAHAYRSPAPTVPPPGGRPSRPSLADGLVLPAWILLGQLLAGIAVVPGMFLVDDPEGSSGVFLAVASVLGWAAVAGGTLLWLRLRRAWRPEWLRGHAPRSGWVAAAAGLGGAVVAFVLLQVVVALLIWVTGSQPPEQEIFELLDDPLLSWVLGAISVLVAPAIEELVFRGVLHDVIARRATWWVAALGQAAIFSAIHIETLTSVPMFVGIGLLGFVFAVLRRLTGSLIAPIVAHLLFNAISVGLSTLV